MVAGSRGSGDITTRSGLTEPAELTLGQTSESYDAASVAGCHRHRRVHDRRRHAPTPAFPLHQAHPQVSDAECVGQAYGTVAVVAVRAESINVLGRNAGVGTSRPDGLQEEHELRIR